MSDFDERVLLGLLIEHQPAHVSTDELARPLGGKLRRPGPRTPSVLALERTGLTHRHDRLAWPTRAALRADELALV
ncbi:MAG: hypothetical protein H0U84_04960 [Thermoleophilaceae bacterium]|nr:hypothetical protein [Thermoleophilaceae bacterium]